MTCSWRAELFTGLVERIGSVISVSRGLAVDTGISGLCRGESLAVDGVCLTVVEAEAARVRFDLSAETSGRTIAGKYRPGSPVNLERPLSADGRFHGHFVSGHVDCVGSIRRVAGSASAEFEIGYPAEYDFLVVEKGSIAVSGISLTIVRTGTGSFAVTLIPETMGKSTAGSWKPGDSVNLEFDILGKHLARWRDLAGRDARLREYLEKPGNSSR
jgi:riboflavin synthase